MKSIIDKTSTVDKTTVIWENSKIRENVVIGANGSIGIGVYIGPGVTIGNHVKVQNGALIYEPAQIADDVFIGPHVILTNDKTPRAIGLNGGPISEKEWKKVGVEICRGASLGAGTICVAPIRIGEWSMTGAGSVVTKDVPDYSLVAGYPARFVRWIGRSGRELRKINSREFVCPDSDELYILSDDGNLRRQD
jgi:UDP-2-acetamido-3-amino-2,3-dideoxy-glucuronate N-acetyltransferase